ncbi:PfkB family carbohydrate kinase [Saccharicrinis fermentans]|uniref:Putative sugar kinase YdjH n=1 Tax=Saccharicrinis fermentans DSM 9555 = JCM 21142 TaxID=869213 RepID=W7YH62_9BACT|nr:PfkB family carbohydrate kinase [Saccharicrinis fermentans]GAF03746.1 putative sugar kinase YdjH [Saccharicrinis fermentans DSM 9555 = JCM 21142]
MRRIFGLGETVLDVVFKEEQALSAKAGGSVLNALVSLARMGHTCYFISEIGNDKVGDIILDFLHKNKINTQYIKRHNEGQSALALAFLDKNNNASYDFYKNYPQERRRLSQPDFKEGDIVLFGSSYAVSPDIRTQVHPILDQANKKNCILLYDPNFRKKHDSHKDLYLQYIQENISLASIIRGSNEDFDNIYQAASSEQTYLKIQKQCAHLIYTAHAHGVFMHSGHMQKHYPVPPLKPVSTIGAGDNFNAGIIHGILISHITKNDLQSLKEQDWDFLIQQGIQFSSEVCKRQDNYVPPGFSTSIKR